jgi:transposase
MTSERYVGLDVHKRHVMVAAVDAQQQLVLAPQKIATHKFQGWARAHLKLTDCIALEATTNAWEIHDQLVPLVAEVAVANCHQLQLISASSRKTDKHDAVVLAKLLAAYILPTVWVPPQSVRDLRALTRHRTQLLQQRSAAKNRLHALLHQHNLIAPEGDPFSAANVTWWEALPLTPVDHLQLRHDWSTIHLLNELLAETETAIAQLSVTEAWDEPMTFLMQLPGIGLYTGMTILAAIGDIERFPSPQQLVGYAGLGARVRASGNTYRTGKITKQGRRELRTALIACAWSAVRWSDHWRAIFTSLANRIGKHKAITAVARKLLVTIWYVLTRREVDRYADTQAIARSFITWASLHHLARSQGLHRLDFVKQRLTRLGIQRQVTSFQANGRTHYLANDS